MEIKKGNEILRIERDDYTDSPRERSNVGVMVCSHNRYTLPNEADLNFDEFNSWGEIEDYLIKEKGAIEVLPIYMYDHSGITISTSYSYPYNDRWDSGQIGFIYTTRDRIKELVGRKLSKKELKNMLNDEVKTYDQYLTGEVYKFELVKLHKCKCCGHISEELVDSCGGFYAIEDIKDYLPKKWHKELEGIDYI